MVKVNFNIHNNDIKVHFGTTCKALRPTNNPPPIFPDLFLRSPDSDRSLVEFLSVLGQRQLKNHAGQNKEGGVWQYWVEINIGNNYGERYFLDLVLSELSNKKTTISFCSSCSNNHPAEFAGIV